MPRIFVTGMSGAGKSSALDRLREKGFQTVDTDTDEWSEWITMPDGSRDWVWREKEIASLLAATTDGALYVSGCKTNQGKFYDRFDHIVLLSAPVEVLVERIEKRSNNPYGKSPAELNEIVEYIITVEPRLRASSTLEIDASLSLSEVVNQLMTLATPFGLSTDLGVI